MVEGKRLNLPLSEADVSGLKAGDMVLLSGRMVTGRDRVHKYLVEQRPKKEDLPFDLTGSVLYHCGPVMKKTEEGYQVMAAGPTTSMRVEMYEAEVIRQYGLRGIMGKGGMGEKTGRALQEAGCVYFQAIGGAAAYLADRIIKTIDAWKIDEFGATEAMWILEVQDFPAIVAMDSHGNSLHKEVEAASLLKLKELLKQK